MALTSMRTTAILGIILTTLFLSSHSAQITSGRVSHRLDQPTKRFHDESSPIQPEWQEIGLSNVEVGLLKRQPIKNSTKKDDELHGIELLKRESVNIDNLDELDYAVPRQVNDRDCPDGVLHCNVGGDRVVYDAPKKRKDVKEEDGFEGGHNVSSSSIDKRNRLPSSVDVPCYPESSDGCSANHAAR